MRASEDGELLPPVVVEVPDTLYLQVVDVDDCEDFPAPSEPSERTFTTERLNDSDVAYVPAARAERAEAELAAVRDAAHVPDDWAYGLPSWINQRLYAAYIGAAFSPDVMERIRAGRLTFPEAPIYAERDALRAEWDAARAGWLDPDTQYPADRQPIIVLLEHEATYYTGEDDPTGDALPEFELWGYQRIVGWRPLPAAPDDGGEEE